MGVEAGRDAHDLGPLGCNDPDRLLMVAGVAQDGEDVVVLHESSSRGIRGKGLGIRVRDRH
jgi:hypothetical protein